MSSSDSSFSVFRVSRVRSAEPSTDCSREPERRTLFLLLLGSGGVGTAGGSGTTCSRGRGTATRADVDEQVLDVLAFQSL